MINDIDKQSLYKLHWLIWESESAFSQWLGTWFTSDIFFWEVEDLGEFIMVQVMVV